MPKFEGEFTELKDRVSQIGYVGKWVEENGKVVFRSDDGAILNWWSSTKTVNFQGAPEARMKLQAAFFESHPADTPAGSIDPVSAATSLVDDATTTFALDSSIAETDKVFVVYGHDESAREQLELILHRLGLEPFVLGNTSGSGLTIIESLEDEIATQAEGNRFGIVLLTPDDMGFNREEDSSNAEPRARQNVVMEMGMLIAAFGRRRVAILKKGHVVVPSDASGIIYLPFNNHVRETAPKLCQRLGEAGFKLNPESITKASS